MALGSRPVSTVSNMARSSRVDEVDDQHQGVMGVSSLIAPRRGDSRCP